MKYLVVSTYERISEKEGVFLTLDDAQRKMQNLLEEHFSKRLEESLEDYGEDFDWGITERSCWSNASEEEFDVNIVEIETDNEYIVVSFKERIFSYNGSFKTEVQAYSYMEKLIKEYFEKDLEEDIADCENSRDDEWGIESDFAWSNMNGKNFDINILTIKEND